MLRLYLLNVLKVAFFFVNLDQMSDTCASVHRESNNSSQVYMNIIVLILMSVSINILGVVKNIYSWLS